MQNNLSEYNDLVALLLGPIKKWPGMFLGEAKISLLQNFILGYNMGYQIALKNNHTTDPYFGEDGFLSWFYTKYKISQTSIWITPFLDEANNNEEVALKLFFKYLEEYNQERNK